MKIFTEHPKSVGETYWSHLLFAIKCGLKLLLAGIVCTIHAFLPFLFVETASKLVNDVYSLLNNRN